MIFSKPNTRAVGFLQHMHGSFVPWCVAGIGAPGAAPVATFLPAHHGQAAAWIGKISKRNVVTLMDQPLAPVSGRRLVRADIPATRHFGIKAPLAARAELANMKPAPFLLMGTPSTVYAVWRLKMPSANLIAVENTARLIAERFCGASLGFLCPIGWTRQHDGTFVDVFELRKDRECLLSDFAETATSRNMFTRATSITAVDESWLWPGVIPSGALTLITGQPKAGKTQITLDCAARVSAGSSWPTGERIEAGKVALLEMEDKAASSIVPRLMAMGADVSNIVIRDGRDGALNFSMDMEALSAQLAAIGGVKLLTLSPMLSFFGQQASDDTEVRRRLAPLLKWAANTGAAIVGVLHPPKNAKASLEAQFAGADTYRRAARAAWVVAPDGTDKEPDIKRKRRALMCAGINGAADDLRLFFRIRGVTVEGIATSKIEWVAP